MDYYTTDHLGSVRVITDMDGEICQNPSLNVANASKSEYLYGGKELQTFFGIDWYDSGARFQTTHGTFSSLDPMAESYYPISPYAYCAGDPVNYVDPGGDTLIVSSTGYILERRGDDPNVYYQYRDQLVHFGQIDDVVDVSFIFSNLIKENTRLTRFMNPFRLRSLVRNKGEWDFKNNLKTIYGIANDRQTVFLFKGERMIAEDIGNYHFGAITKSNILISEKFALQQAGKAQISAGTSRPEWQKYEIVPHIVVSPSGIQVVTYQTVLSAPYGDDPNDQRWIKKGFKYKGLIK